MIIRYSYFENQRFVYIPPTAAWRVAVESGDVEEHYNLRIVLCIGRTERIVIYNANHIKEESQAIPFYDLECFLNQMTETMLRDVVNGEEVIDMDRIKQVVYQDLFSKKWRDKGYLHDKFPV